MLAAMVAHAPRGSRLVTSTIPASVGYEVAHASTLSRGWFGDPNPIFPDSVITTTPGTAARNVTVTQGGDYRAWVQGTFPRAVSVSLDGHTVGSVQGNNTPNEWLEAGSVRVTAGSHALELRRGGGDLRPGDGGTGVSDGKGIIGFVTLQSEAPRGLSSTPVARWRHLCGQTADWVELVAG
jgi:hypothetical protein